MQPPEGEGEAFTLSMQPVAFNPPEKGGLHLLCLGGSSGERFFHQVLIVLQCPPPRGWWHLINPAAVCFPRIPVNSDRGKQLKSLASHRLSRKHSGSNDWHLLCGGRRAQSTPINFSKKCAVCRSHGHRSRNRGVQYLTDRQRLKKTYGVFSI